MSCESLVLKCFHEYDIDRFENYCFHFCFRAASLFHIMMQLQLLFTSHIQSYMNTSDKSHLCHSINNTREFMEQHASCEELCHYKLICNIQEQVILMSFSAEVVDQFKNILRTLHNVSDQLEGVEQKESLRGLDCEVLVLVSNACLLFSQQMEIMCRNNLDLLNKPDESNTNSAVMKHLLECHVDLCDVIVIQLSCQLRCGIFVGNDSTGGMSRVRVTIIKTRLSRLTTRVNQMKYVLSDNERGKHHYSVLSCEKHCDILNVECNGFLFNR